MDATNVLGLCWIGAGIILVLGAIGWALLRMTIRALIYLGGMITLIILGGQSFGWGPMIGIGGLALFGGPVGAAVLLVPLGILAVLGPKPRGGAPTIPPPASAGDGGGEVMAEPYSGYAECRKCEWHKGELRIDPQCQMHSRDWS